METNIKNDRYGIGEEKIEWLKKIGATEIKEPYAYSVFNKKMGFPSDFYSVKYLKETPLGELEIRFNAGTTEKENKNSQRQTSEVGEMWTAKEALWKSKEALVYSIAALLVSSVVLIVKLTGIM